MVWLFLALALGVVKLGDQLVAALPAWIRSGDGAGRRTQEWSPVYAGIDSLLGSRDVMPRWLKTLLFDWLYRAPAIAGLQAAMVFGAIGKLHGHMDSGRCVLPSVGSFESLLAIISAAMAVIAASVVVINFLVGAAPNRIAGQLRRPSARQGAPDRPATLGAPVVVIITAASLVFAYSSLYYAIVAKDSSAFQLSPCGLDMFSTLYFSTVVAATVGFGDIVPVTDIARIVVVVQMFFVVTFFAAFVAQLLSNDGRGDRAKTGGRDSNPDSRLQR